MTVYDYNDLFSITEKRKKEIDMQTFFFGIWILLKEEEERGKKVGRRR